MFTWLRHAYSRRYWSWRAERYQAAMSSRSALSGVRARLDWLAEHGLTGGSILDLCCGSGEYALMFAERGFGVVGVDSARGMLAVATEAARARGLACDFQPADLDASLPFADGRFDAVVCIWALHHAVSPRSAVREVKRVLKPGGLFLVVTLSATNRYQRRHGRRSALYRSVWGGLRRASRAAMKTLTAEELTAIGLAAGFEVVDSRGVDRRGIEILFRAR